MDFLTSEGPWSSEAQKAVGGLPGALEGKSTFNDLRPGAGQPGARFASRGPGAGCARAGWHIGQLPGAGGPGPGKPPFPGGSGNCLGGRGRGRPGPGARAVAPGASQGPARGPADLGLSCPICTPRCPKSPDPVSPGPLDSIYVFSLSPPPREPASARPPPARGPRGPLAPTPPPGGVRGGPPLPRGQEAPSPPWPPAPGPPGASWGPWDVSKEVTVPKSPVSRHLGTESHLGACFVGQGGSDPAPHRR